MRIIVGIRFFPRKKNLVLKLHGSQQFENSRFLQPIFLAGFHKLNLRNCNIFLENYFFTLFFQQKNWPSIYF